MFTQLRIRLRDLLHPLDLHETSGTGDFEMKYTFHISCLSGLIQYFDMHYPVDGEYPMAKVQSIYMDDSRMSSYAEKVNSDFFKTKYRIRWYEGISPSSSDESTETYVFFEKKMKEGVQRNKKREKIYLPTDEILKKPLHHSCHKYWKEQFVKYGVRKNIEPLIQISYLRRRYLEQHSLTRINLDYNITVEKTNQLYFPGTVGMPLATGVLEVKRPVFCPPESLAYVTRNMVKKDNFSKYEQCFSTLKSCWKI